MVFSYMKIHTYLQCGLSHPTYCEDFLFIHQVNSRFHFSAVMDGCSMGKDSHFASALQGKILAKIIQLLPYQLEIDLKTISLEELSEHIFRHFFDEMKQQKSALLLDRTEMLSTLIAMIWDVEQASAYLFAAGDGLWAINDELIEFDHQNKPDYPAYHLGKPFEQWYTNQPKKLVSQPFNIAISTDGASSYQGRKGSHPDDGEVEKYFLTGFDFMDEQNMLDRKANWLLKEKGWVPFDDMAVVRLITR